MVEVPVQDEYESPLLTVLGGVYELTLSGDCVDKQFGPTDGHTFMGIAIACASP